MANRNFKVRHGLEVGTGVTISGADGNINISGIITATFSGDGSGLTGVVAEGSGVVVQEEGSNIGTAGTINFIGTGVTATLSGGIASIEISSSGGGGGLSDVVSDTTPQLGGNLDLNSKNITGTGNISITGGFNATGVSTFQENVVFQSTASFGDNDKANFGAGNDLQIYHDGSNSYIDDAGTGEIRIRVADTGGSGFYKYSSNEKLATFEPDGPVTLYFNDSAKLATSNTGVTVTGTLAATAVTGDGSGLTGLPAAGISDVVADTTPQLGGNLDLNNKDVVGIGSISITGIATVRGSIAVGHGSTTFAPLSFTVDNQQNTYIAHIGSGVFQSRTDSNNGMMIWANSAAGQIVLRNGTGIGVVNRLTTSNTGVTISGTLAATAVTGDGSGLTDLTGASAGTYGASGAVPIITVDSNGRITGISTTAVSGGGGGGGIDNIVQDTTPQLGGDLDLNGNDISGTGNITITSTDAGSSAGPEFKLWRNSASPADADYLGQIKFAGESDTGVERNYAKITGKISDASNGTEDGIIEIAHIKAGSQNISARWTSSELKFLNGTDISMADGLKVLLGTGDDAEIYHDGTDAYFTNSTGQLLVRGNDIKLQSSGGETYATFANNGAVSLYHDNALRLATTNTGVSITDNLNVAGISTFQGNINLGDNDKAIFGAGNDLQIYHSTTGNVNYIDVSQPLYFRSTHGSGTQFYFQATSGENSLVLNHNGSVELYHDSSKKLETTSAGVTVTGTLAATAVTGDGSGLTNLPSSGISTAISNVQVTYSVTASGNNYRLTGPGHDAGENNPDIYLVRGQRYRFINNSGGSHPFQIRSSPGGSAYSTGVTNNGASSGNIDFNVQTDGPARLYYQCTVHSSMVGNIYIVGGSDWRMTDVNTSNAPEIYTTRNVGIGTDNPLNSLDINQSTGRFRVNGFSHLLMQNKNDSTTDYWGISARNGGELDIGYGTPDGNSLIGGDKLTITSAGRVNIGSASDVDHTLCVAGTDNTTGLTGGHSQGIQLQNKSTTDGTYSQIEWRTAAGGRCARIAGIQTNADGNGGELAFLTESAAGITTEALRIDHRGHVMTPYSTTSKVGINFSPNNIQHGPQYNLEVTGDFYAREIYTAYKTRLTGSLIFDGENDTQNTSLGNVVGIDIRMRGMYRRFSSQPVTDWTPNFQHNQSDIDSVTHPGDVFTATIIVKQRSAGSPAGVTVSGVQVDGTATGVDLDWVGGSAPGASPGTGWDVWTFIVMKTSDTPTYHVLGKRETYS